MAKDFANRRSRQPPTPRGTARRSPRKRRWRLSFHGPSFAAGIALGCCIVLMVTYVEPVFEPAPAEVPVPAHTEPPATVTFEFDSRLRSAEVHSDPQPYASTANPHPDQQMEYLIQAASFRLADDAESLRQELELIELPAQTSLVSVGSNPWFRVTVGPFLNQVEAGRAMTRLRQRNLDAFLIKRPRAMPPG